MDKCRMQIRQQAPPRNMGTAMTSGPVPLTTPKCCTHRPGMRCVQSNACPCQAANCPCTRGYPSDNCRNQGPTQGPTEPRLTTNVSETIEDSQEAATQSSSTKTHQSSHPASSWENMSGLPYQRMPTPPTRPQCSPRPPPLTPPHRRLPGAAK